MRSKWPVGRLAYGNATHCSHTYDGQRVSVCGISSLSAHIQSIQTAAAVGEHWDKLWLCH